jgi:hypothetical protein
VQSSARLRFVVTSDRLRPALTRRELLLSALAVAAAAGAGAVVGVRQPWSAVSGRATPPVSLVDALGAEADALALVDAAITAQPGLRAVLSGIRADHAAHAAALTASLQRYPAGSWTARAGRAAATTDRAALAGAERAAATAAARRAAALAGADAVLLASIAACESSHVGLLA